MTVLRHRDLSHLVRGVTVSGPSWRGRTTDSRHDLPIAPNLLDRVSINSEEFHLVSLSP
jgi:hypothetical protein